MSCRHSVMVQGTREDAPRNSGDAKVGEDETSQSVLESLAGYNLKRAYRVVQDNFRAAWGKHELTTRMFHTLALVVENPNITQSEISRILQIKRSGLVAIIDHLEERQLLRRNGVAGDRRVYALTPTPAGLRHFRDALQLVRHHEKHLLSSLSRGEQAQLLVLLQKIRPRKTGG